MVYFDNAATTKPCKEAISVLNNSLLKFGNPSSLHGLGLEASQIISLARKQIASSLGVDDSEIYFTSGATEANNTAIFGAASKLGKRMKKIVISSVEHPSVSEPCRILESKGFDVVKISPQSDGFHVEDFVNAVDENTCLVSCMLCNNEIGAMLPVSEVFKTLKKKYPQTILHCDFVQGFLKLSLKQKELHADMISLSGHKIHALKGVGALYIKKNLHIPPFIFGGGQERGFRSGTESVPLISSFGAAADAMYKNLDANFHHVQMLSEHLRCEVKSLDGIVLNSPSDGSPYINSISVGNIRSEVLLHFLEGREIYVSSGSACSKGKKSKVLTEFHIPDSVADSTIRISFCPENTIEEVDLLLEALKDAKNNLVGIK